MPRDLPKHVQETAKGSGKYRSHVVINRKVEHGPTRDTVAETQADAEEPVKRQKELRLARKRASNEAAQVRSEHADELAANYATSGGNRAKDMLSRKFLSIALQGTGIVATSGVPSLRPTRS